MKDIINELPLWQVLLIAGGMVGLAYFGLAFTTDVMSGTVRPIKPARGRTRSMGRRRRGYRRN